MHNLCATCNRVESTKSSLVTQLKTGQEDNRPRDYRCPHLITTTTTYLANHTAAPHANKMWTSTYITTLKVATSPGLTFYMKLMFQGK
jgi:hypothetical protein